MILPAIAKAQAVATAVGSVAATNKIIVKAFGNWTASRTDRSSLIARFSRLADKPRVLGFSEQLILDEYANSPILVANESTPTRNSCRP